MIHLDGTLRTDAMDFATFLRLEGFNPRMEKMGKSKVEWVLGEDVVAEDGELLQEIVVKYQTGEEQVEPRRFYNELRIVRQELYALLRHQAVRVNTRGRTSPSASQ